MTQHFFNGDNPMDAANLDANFSDLYPLLAAITPSGGRVGIGGAPTSLVDIQGAGSEVRIRDTSSSATLRLYDASSNCSIETKSGQLTFGVSAIERGRFDASANFLVGTASNSYAGGGIGLQTSGSSSNASNINIGHPTGASSGSVFMQFAYNGSLIGSITQSGTTGVSYNTSSDYRLKSGVTPIVDSGAFIDALNPVTYTWISDNTPGAGFVAHELQAVSPSSVTGAKDAVQDVGNLAEADGTIVQTSVPEPAQLQAGQTWTKTGTVPVYQGVEYGSPEMIAMMAAELKAQRARFVTLEVRVAAMEAR